jgi:hypothetical protein
LLAQPTEAAMLIASRTVNEVRFMLGRLLFFSSFEVLGFDPGSKSSWVYR